MVVAPLVKHPDILYFDNQLLEWYDNLPAALKDHEPCTESMSMARTIMRWRYCNQRMLLYRPTLLSYAMRRIPYIALRSEERTAVEKCREIADMTIRDICATTQPNQMSGWNGVWMLFQAVMVPILGLFLSDNTSGDARATVGACQSQVELAMITLARMKQWSPTAKRTLDVVSRIFEASKRGPEMDSLPQYQTTGLAPALPDPAINESGIPDPFTYQFPDDPTGQNLWDYLSWSDNNLWPGLADFQVSGDMMGHDKDGNVGFFENMPDPTSFMNPSMPFY